MNTIIVLDDEQQIREDLEYFLGEEGYKTYTGATIEEVHNLISKDIDCAIIDLHLGDSSPVGGLEVYLYFLRNKPKVKTLILSAYPFESADKLLAGGLREPDDKKQIAVVMERIKNDYVYKGEGNYIDAVVARLV